MGTEHAYSLKETLQRAEHRALYDGQLRDARRRRQAQTTALPDPTDPVSLGLQQAAGLKEPAVTLPAFKDPLWLQDKIIVRPKHRWDLQWAAWPGGTAFL